MFLPGKEIGWKRFFSALKTEWTRDNLTNAGGALTFFGVLSLFPFLLFCVTLAGLLVSPDQMEQLIGQLARVAPQDAVKIVADEIRDIHKNQSVGLLTLGFVGAIWTASGAVTSLIDALNGVYAVQEQRPYWKVRLIAIGTVLVAGLVMAFAAVAAVAAGPLAAHLPQPFATIVTWARLPVAGIAMMLVWAALYYVLPDVEQRFKFITPGSVLGVLVWILASWGFSFYAQHFGSYQKTYGAIGGVVVMLMWMWISSIVMLLGAVVNGIIEHLSPDGKVVGAKSMAETGIDKTKTEKQDAGELGGPDGETATAPPPRRPRPRVRPVREAPGRALLKAAEAQLPRMVFFYALRALLNRKRRPA